MLTESYGAEEEKKSVAEDDLTVLRDSPPLTRLMDVDLMARLEGRVGNIGQNLTSEKIARIIQAYKGQVLSSDDVKERRPGDNQKWSRSTEARRVSFQILGDVRYGGQAAIVKVKILEPEEHSGVVAALRLVAPCWKDGRSVDSVRQANVNERTAVLSWLSRNQVDKYPALIKSFAIFSLSLPLPTDSAGGGASYVVDAELLEWGRPLESVLNTPGGVRPSVGELREWMAPVALTLWNLWRELQIVHRDIDAGNLMLVGDKLKICDFGAMSLVRAGHSETQSMPIGKRGKMPPEVYFHNAKAVSHYTDAWLFGRTLFEMCTGRSSPYVCKDDGGGQLIVQWPVLFDSRVRDLEDPLEHVIRGLCDEDPNLRRTLGWAAALLSGKEPVSQQTTGHGLERQNESEVKEKSSLAVIAEGISSFHAIPVPELSEPSFPDSAGFLGKYDSNLLTQFLVWLGGGDLSVLSGLRASRSRFFNQALVMLGTASFGALSMFYALTSAVFAKADGSGLVEPTSIKTIILSSILAIMWFCFILSVDRMMVLSMRGKSGWALLLNSLPRLGLAVVIGVVVATPITLQVFKSEINAEVVAQNARDADARRTSPENVRLEGQVSKLAEEVHKMTEIAMGASVEDLLKTSAEQEAQENHDQAVDEVNEAEAAIETLRKTKICEVNPDQKECEGLVITGNVGCDGACEDAGKEADRVKDELDELKANVTSAKSALDAAQASPEALALRENQKQDALNGLCGQGATLDDLMRRQAFEDSAAGGVGPAPGGEAPSCVNGKYQTLARLQEQLSNDTLASDVRGRVGLLSQLSALQRLGQHSDGVRLWRLWIDGLFIIVEMLPVLMAVFVGFGGENIHDKALRVLEKEELDSMVGAVQDRGRLRSEKQEMIALVRSDRIEREKALAIALNERQEEWLLQAASRVRYGREA